MAPAPPADLARSYKFNPSFQTDDEAISGFVVRKNELDTVVGALLANSYAEKPSHVLITAPRGAGKTTLVRRVLAEVRLNDDLSRAWFPIFLAEESYTITTPGEFFLECLFHLQDQLKDPKWQRAYADAESQTTEASLARTALSALTRFAQEQGKRLLLIVENFHMILNEQIGSAAQTLQDTIDDEGIFMVLATSVRDATDAEPGYATVLERYQIIPLQPLNLVECQQLWESLTHQDVRPERIRPLQILTGGSPRLIRIMAEFTVAPSLQNLLENLNQLIDQNTEYFKSHLDSLPPTERKVFAALLDIWDPSTAKEVADSARVNVNVASAMLGRLTDRGSVIKLPGKGRSATYHAAERLFNIYYLMRRRSHPSSRVRALVAFMTQYYRGDELIDTTAKLVAEACALKPQNRADYHTTFSAIIAQSSDEIRAKILSQTPKDFLSSIVSTDDFRAAITANDQHIDDEERTSPRRARSASQNSARRKFLADVHTAVERKDDAAVHQLLNAARETDVDRADVWLELALSLHNSADHVDSAVEAARRAVLLEPNRSMPHAVLAMFLNDSSGPTEEIEDHVAAALQYDPENSLALTVAGDVKHAQKCFEEALEYYRKAWASAPDFQLALTNLASMLGPHLERYDEAEALLREALRKHPDWENARDELARLLASQHRTAEAQQLLRDGVTLDKRSPSRWANLGQFLYWRSHDYAGSKDALERAIKLGADRPSVWSTYARVQQRLGEATSEVMQAANKAIELAPDTVDPWLTLGDVTKRQGDLIAAERAYRSAIDVDNKSIRAWFDLGMLLQKLPNRTAEAEVALRNAQAASERCPCSVRKELAALLIHKGNDKEATELLQQAVESNRDCYCSLTLLAAVASRHRDLAGAKSYFESALTVNPEGVTAMTGLAQLLIEQGSDLDSAKSLIDRALKANPEDARAFLARGLLNRSQVSPAACLADLRKALKLDPDLLEAKLILSLVEASVGQFDTALVHLTEVMRALDQRRELLSGVVDAAVLLAQRDRISAVLQVIKSAGAEEYLEPLCVALQMAQGEKPRVAKEVLEVADDIYARIVSPQVTQSGS